MGWICKCGVENNLDDDDCRNCGALKEPWGSKGNPDIGSKGYGGPQPPPLPEAGPAPPTPPDTGRRFMIETMKVLMAAKTEAARLAGYIDRVRETEVAQGNSVRTAANLNAETMLRGLRAMSNEEFERMTKDLPTERIEWLLKGGVIEGAQPSEPRRHYADGPRNNPNWPNEPWSGA